MAQIAWIQTHRRRLKRRLFQKRNQINMRRLNANTQLLTIALDEWITYYNNDRTHQGKMCCGRTPIQTLNDGIAIWKEKAFN